MNSNKDPNKKVKEVTSPARLSVKDYGENRKVLPNGGEYF